MVIEVEFFEYRRTSEKGHVWKGEWPRFRYCVECGTVALPNGKNGRHRFMLTVGGERRFVSKFPPCPPPLPMTAVERAWARKRWHALKTNGLMEGATWCGRMAYKCGATLLRYTGGAHELPRKGSCRACRRATGRWW